MLRGAELSGAIEEEEQVCIFNMLYIFRLLNDSKRSAKSFLEILTELESWAGF